MFRVFCSIVFEPFAIWLLGSWRTWRAAIQERSSSQPVLNTATKNSVLGNMITVQLRVKQTKNEFIPWSMSWRQLSQASACFGNTVISSDNKKTGMRWLSLRATDRFPVSVMSQLQDSLNERMTCSHVTYQFKGNHVDKFHCPWSTSVIDVRSLQRHTV